MSRVCVKNSREQPTSAKIRCKLLSWFSTLNLFSQKKILHIVRKNAKTTVGELGIPLRARYVGRSLNIPGDRQFPVIPQRENERFLNFYLI